jgi:hypothetical protein
MGEGNPNHDAQGRFSSGAGGSLKPVPGLKSDAQGRIKMSYVYDGKPAGEVTHDSKANIWQSETAQGRTELHSSLNDAQSALEREHIMQTTGQRIPEHPHDVDVNGKPLLQGDIVKVVGPVQGKGKTGKIVNARRGFAVVHVGGKVISFSMSDLKHVSDRR